MSAIGTVGQVMGWTAGAAAVGFAGASMFTSKHAATVKLEHPNHSLLKSVGKTAAITGGIGGVLSLAIVLPGAAEFGGKMLPAVGVAVGLSALLGLGAATIGAGYALGREGGLHVKSPTL